MRWDFAFDRWSRVVLAPWGITAGTASVFAAADEFSVDFGLWRLRTTMSNVVGAKVTGPYSWLRAVGAHMSMVDRGVTFGTNADLGVCVCFREPVPALLPVAAVKHPAVTVTVADPESLASYLVARTRT